MRHLITTLLAAPSLIVLFHGCLPMAAQGPHPRVITDSELCPLACAHLKEMKCPEGSDFYDNDKPGQKGIPNQTCLDFCKRQQGNGIFVNPRCLMEVPSCDKVEEWRQKDCTLVADAGPDAK